MESPTEDDMVNALIEYHQQKTDGWNRSDNDVEHAVDLYPEAQYNHYGNRGAADLLAVETATSDSNNKHTDATLYEVKSDYAIQNSTGANEILRQFNRMRRNFFRDESWPAPNSLQIELVFVPTPVTAKHVADNIQMYRTAAKNTLCHLDSAQNMALTDVREMILFRMPDADDMTPVGVHKPGVIEDYAQYARENNPRIWEIIRPAFDK